MNADLTGRLLVATPALSEGVFHRSVVLVLHHDGDGAHGVILNRPTGAGVDAVLPGWQSHVTHPQRVFDGGPVGSDSALGIASLPAYQQESVGVRRLFRSVAVIDLDAPPVLVVPEVAGLRIFAGYAGWGPSQLELEIAEGSWYVIDSEARDPFTDAPDEMWATVLRRQRDRLALVATFPSDPELN